MTNREKAQAVFEALTACHLCGHAFSEHLVYPQWHGGYRRCCYSIVDIDGSSYICNCSLDPVDHD